MTLMQYIGILGHNLRLDVLKLEIENTYFLQEANFKPTDCIIKE